MEDLGLLGRLLADEAYLAVAGPGRCAATKVISQEVGFLHRDEEGMAQTLFDRSIALSQAYATFMELGYNYHTYADDVAFYSPQIHELEPSCAAGFRSFTSFSTPLTTSTVLLSNNM